MSAQRPLPLLPPNSLQAALPRLRTRLTEVLAAEHHARWFSDYLRVEKMRNAAAGKFARQCPELLAVLDATWKPPVISRTVQ